jgi:uncharacterized repeat protein (TIGR01451 family)
MATPSSGSRKRGRMKRKLVALGAAALAAVAVSGLSAGSAQADPVSMSFDHGLIDLGTLKGQTLLDDTTGPITVDGDLTGNTLTANADDVTIPPLDVQGIVTVTMTETAPVTGTFDAATGALDAHMVIDADVTGAVECTFTGLALDLSTSNTTAYQGVPFTSGITGNGALSGSWADLPPDNGAPGCATVRGVAGGPGGLWISHGIASPPAPPKAVLKASVKPGSATAKVGKGAAFTVTVKNTGDADATGAKVCAKPPKGISTNPKCKTLGTIASGDSGKAKFTVKSSKKTKPKSYKVKFTAKATDVKSASTTATLKVKK